MTSNDARSTEALVNDAASPVRAAARLVFDPRMVGALRAVAGAVMVIRPSSVGEGWIGTSDETTRVLIRSIGARDLVMGGGLVANPTVPWLLASIGADLADGLEATIGAVPPARRTRVRSLAFGFALYSVLSMVVRASDHQDGERVAR